MGRRSFLPRAFTRKHLNDCLVTFHLETRPALARVLHTLMRGPGVSAKVMHEGFTVRGLLGTVEDVVFGELLLELDYRKESEYWRDTMSMNVPLLSQLMAQHVPGGAHLRMRSAAVDLVAGQLGNQISARRNSSRGADGIAEVLRVFASSLTSTGQRIVGRHGDVIARGLASQMTVEHVRRAGLAEALGFHKLGEPHHFCEHSPQFVDYCLRILKRLTR